MVKSAPTTDQHEVDLGIAVWHGPAHGNDGTLAPGPLQYFGAVVPIVAHLVRLEGRATKEAFCKQSKFVEDWAESTISGYRGNTPKKLGCSDAPFVDCALNRVSQGLDITLCYTHSILPFTQL